jgi:hypothetical protein
MSLPARDFVQIVCCRRIRRDWVGNGSSCLVTEPERRPDRRDLALSAVRQMFPDVPALLDFRFRKSIVATLWHIGDQTWHKITPPPPSKIPAGNLG